MIKTHLTLTLPDGGSMGAYAASPAPAGGSPGLIVFQEAFGVNAHIRATVDRFAEAGFVAIAPELFHRTAPPGWECGYADFQPVLPHLRSVTADGLQADARACFEWLQQQPQVKKGAIACIGYCLGGRASFAANLVLPLKAAISYYGGGIAPDLIKRASELHAPMLFCWGGLDKHIGPEQRAAVAAGLSEAGKPCVSVEFSQADHGFSCDDRPVFNPAASREALSLTLAFLKENLSDS